MFVFMPITNINNTSKEYNNIEDNCIEKKHTIEKENNIEK
jgi:hypothetical protein